MKRKTFNPGTEMWGPSEQLNYTDSTYVTTKRMTMACGAQQRASHPRKKTVHLYVWFLLSIDVYVLGDCVIGDRGTLLWVFLMLGWAMPKVHPNLPFIRCKNTCCGDNWWPGQRKSFREYARRCGNLLRRIDDSSRSISQSTLLML